MALYKFDHVFSSDGWLSPGFISVNQFGEIDTLSEVQPPVDTCENVGGIALPGISNLHSHTFQRALAGLTEYRTAASQDSFWTWRNLMYRFAAAITPDDMEAIAGQLDVEMLKSGYTARAEFHYLHHDPDGNTYDNPAEMAIMLLEASLETGIGLTMLPVLYQYSGFGSRPPAEEQRRFINNVEGFLNIHNLMGDYLKGRNSPSLGVAFHSLRAVDLDSMNEVIASVDSSSPIHIHIAEQKKEVEDCRRWSDLRPVELLYDCFDVDDRWCLVHATHMTQEENNLAAQSGVIAGICPTTEANLGDGVFGLRNWVDLGGAFGIGSDSNTSVSPVEELRWLEYTQRLIHQTRNVMAEDRSSTGESLFQKSIQGGAIALGRSTAQLGVGVSADIIVLDSSQPIFTGQNPKTFFDSWLFSGNSSVIRDVFVAGKRVVKDGRHSKEDEILARYQKAVGRLLSKI